VSSLLEKRRGDIFRLVLKNLYSSDIGFLLGTSSKLDYSCVLDRQLLRENAVESLFHSPGLRMPQYGSTVLTAVMLAFHAGFGEIVVHGLDFSGPHIYHAEELQTSMGMGAPTPYVDKTVAHGTAAAQELIWPALMDEFHKRGVSIYCASPQSNFRKYAPTYNTKRACATEGGQGTR